MKIKQIKRNTDNFSKFMLKEWKLIHPIYFGGELDLSYWLTQHIYFEAIEKKKIIGGLIGEFTGGVLFIPELIVTGDSRGKGVGVSLLRQAESWAKNHRGHEVYLVTGKNWKAKEFYFKSGYAIAAELPKHFSKKDFVLLRKFLD